MMGSVYATARSASSRNNWYWRADELAGGFIRERIDPSTARRQAGQCLVAASRTRTREHCGEHGGGDLGARSHHRTRNVPGRKI